MTKSISLVPNPALAKWLAILANELGDSALSTSMRTSGSPSFHTRGQNRECNGHPSPLALNSP